MEVETISLSDWDHFLPESIENPFHQSGSLRAIDQNTDGEMRLYAGMKGEEPAALFPVFVNSFAGMGRFFSSPPPGMNIPYLGPVLDPKSPKPRKREQLNRRFTEGLLDELEPDQPFDLVRFVCTPEFDDPRPFRWSGLDPEAYFTYRVDLDSESTSAIQDRFSSSLRRELRKAEDLDVDVEDEGVEGAKQIHRDLTRRYREQDIELAVSEDFVTDLVEELGDRARAYVLRENGEYVSGIVAIYSADSVFFWLGGTRASVGNISANTLLHGHIITEAVEADGDGPSWYDLIGAQSPRLAKYKSKFGGDLVPYYAIESEGPLMTLAKKAYWTFKR